MVFTQLYQNRNDNSYSWCGFRMTTFYFFGVVLEELY